jgi:ATP-binding protein involved in chromosome partitioning
MPTTETLTALLPARVRERVQSLRLAEGGTVTLVLDGAGLDAPRARRWNGAKAALAADPAVIDVRVGIVADRARRGAKPAGPLILAVGSGKGGVGKSTPRPIWRWGWRGWG